MTWARCPSTFLFLALALALHLLAVFFGLACALLQGALGGFLRDHTRGM